MLQFLYEILWAGNIYKAQEFPDYVLTSSVVKYSPTCVHPNLRFATTWYADRQ